MACQYYLLSHQNQLNETHLPYKCTMYTMTPKYIRMIVQFCCDYVPDKSTQVNGLKTCCWCNRFTP